MIEIEGRVHPPMRRRAAAALLVLAACARAPATVEVRLTQGDRGLVIRAEVADTQDERRKGLMGREALDPGAGMLFVWDDLAARCFTMRGTLIPLDLAVIAAGEVVQVIRMEPGRDEQDCPYVTRGAEAALEVAAGTLARARIGVGALVTTGGGA